MVGRMSILNLWRFSIINRQLKIIHIECSQIKVHYMVEKPRKKAWCFFGRSWKCIKSICVLLLVLQLPTCQLTNREIIYLPYIITVSEKDENFSFSKLILPRFWVYYGQTARSFDQKDIFLSLKVFEWLIDLIAKKSNTKRETFNRILQKSRSVKEKIFCPMFAEKNFLA